MALKSPVYPGGPRRGRFKQFAEYASNFHQLPAFFRVCLLLVGFFIAAHAARLKIEVLLLAGECMKAVTLLLLVLLKNSEMRAEHAVQRKLDSIARALLETRSVEGSGDKGDALQELKNAIRMEEETRGRRRNAVTVLPEPYQTGDHAASWTSCSSPAHSTASPSVSTRSCRTTGIGWTSFSPRTATTRSVPRYARHALS
ncbi:hypothetical protein [Streptomyces coelicoflavus]|uniref:hypothetical protein n=1 Tax=Streptomyces coelicoflavus TaxID=285562 RepID=UPI0036AFD7BE